MKPVHNSEDPDFGMLETFQSIDMEKDWNQVRQRMGFEKGRAPKKRDLARVWRAAATIIVILGVGYLTQLYFFSAQDRITTLAKDEVQLVLLPDGSKVTMNINSEISYPEKFRGKKREVRLSGEAFFEVERNPKKPFMVRIEEKALVEVLGTSFNIRSVLSEDAINVLVVEGRVAFKGASNEKPGLILKKDEQATLTHGTLRREEVVNKNMLSWKTGILSFDQSFIGDVVTQLEAHYMRDIILEEDIPRDLKFTSTIDNQDLESVLEELSLVLGLAVSFKDDKLHISKPHE